MSERKIRVEGIEYVRLSPDTAVACWRLEGGGLDWSWAWSALGYGSRGAYKTRQEAEAALERVMATQAVAA